MEGIGEIVTQADLKSLQQWAAQSWTKRAYVAPSVYRLPSENTTKGWYYWNTLEEAMRFYRFLLNEKGTTLPKPAGQVSFTTAATAQTMGINVDFFFSLPVVGSIVLPYAWVKQKMAQPGNVVLPFRFYKKDGSGPYYSVFSSTHMGMAATSINNIATDKVAALDEYHRQLQLLKAKHNTLALYLKDLSTKQLKPVQQQSFNEGLLLLNGMREEMRKLRGVDVTYLQNGSIAAIPVLLLILIISVVAAAAAWTVTQITSEAAKVAKLNASYNTIKWVSDQQLKISQALKSGQINQAEYNDMMKTLQAASDTANKAVVDVTKDSDKPGLLDKLQNLLLIGLGGYALIQFTKKSN